MKRCLSPFHPSNVRFLDGMPEKEMDWIPGAVPRSVKLHSLEYTTANALIVDKLFEKYKAKNPQKTRELVAVWNIDNATTQGKTIVKKNTIKDW